jgi:uncharacterized delta-60 repeat protein
MLRGAKRVARWRGQLLPGVRWERCERRVFGRRLRRVVQGVAAVALALTTGAGARGGQIDPSFGIVRTEFGIFARANAVAVEAGGGLVAAGDSYWVSDTGGQFDFGLVRYTPEGGEIWQAQTDFGDSHSHRDMASAVAIQTDGKIVAAGGTDANGDNDFALARYGSDGTLDPGFGNGGRVLTDFGSKSSDSASAAAIQSDGKIVAAGTSDAGGGYDFALARYLPDGSLDPTFGSGGKVLTSFFGHGGNPFEVVIQADGRIVVAGTSSSGIGGADFALARYLPDGRLDASFGSGGKVLTDFRNGTNDIGLAATIQSDGKIVAAGLSDAGGRNDDFALARYLADGGLDPGFGTGGKVLTGFRNQRSEDWALAVSTQADGKIVAAGQSGDFRRSAFALVRYLPDGSLDSHFGKRGKVRTDVSPGFDAAQAVAIQPNGRIVAAGGADRDRYGDRTDFALVGYRSR